MPADRIKPIDSTPLTPTLFLRDPGAIILLVIAVFAGAWRTYGLEREGMGLDEISQARIARGNRSSELKGSLGKSYVPAASLVSATSWMWLGGRAAKEQQPPLDYALQRIVNQFSARDAAQRAVACACGTIAVFLTGWLGVLLGGLRVGIVSELLLSVLPLHVEMSRTARPYTIAHVMWLAVMLIGYWAYRTNTRRAWIIFAAAALVFLMTRGDLPLFALAALGLLFLVIRCWRGVVALLAAGTLYLPVFALLLYSGRGYLASGQTFSFNAQMLTRAIGALAGPLPYILLSLAVLGVWAVRRQPLALWFVGLCGLTLLLHLSFWFARVGSPLFPRYLVHYSTPLAILAAFGFWSVVSLLSPPRYTLPVGAGLFFIGFIGLGALAFQREQLPTKEGWREAALFATQQGIDHIWMFKTGPFVAATPAGPGHVMWVPEFLGDWYRPIASSMPLSVGGDAPSGKLAVVVWEEDLYDAGREPLLDVDNFDHIRFYRLHMYVPRSACGPHCTMEGVLKILSRQSGYLEFQREVMRLGL